MNDRFKFQIGNIGVSFSLAGQTGRIPAHLPAGGMKRLQSRSCTMIALVSCEEGRHVLSVYLQIKGRA